MSQENKELRARILRLYYENHTAADIARILQCSKQNVSQLFQSMGLPRQKYIQIKPYRRTPLTTRQLFWQQVDVRGEDECWEWQGKRWPSGYGHFNVKIRGHWWRYAHRLAFVFTHRRLPKECILHSCDNPPCCNPNHLRDGTHKDNAQDRETRGRGRRKRIPDIPQQQICDLYRIGATMRQLGRRFHIPASYVRDILIERLPADELNQLRYRKNCSRIT